jgi:hypothetical protein
MSTAYKPRSESNKLVLTKGQTLGELLTANGLAGQLDKVGLFNWGTKDPAEINRALVELVGCSEVKDDPLQSVIDPALGTTKAIHKPEPWQPELAFEKVYTVKVKKRLPATAVAITELTPFFDPESESCTLKVRYEGVAARADKRTWEVHATGYYDTVVAKGVTVDKPSGTDSADPTHTHLVRKAGARAPGVETLTWDGTSDATEGVLKNPAKIHSRCAPYIVMVRFYKDDADKDAQLVLEPFYPRWRLVGKARHELVEESLVVKWKLTAAESSKGKLVQGQLTVHDGDGKVVFTAPLGQGQIAGGSYDLLKGPVKWDKAKVDRKKLPYRVQVQAHSGADEEQGLALAAMPTQVPAYDYDQVQLIGFNIRNDTKVDEYLGRYTSGVDISDRSAVMIEAMQIAHGKASANRKILKVFVAPEFYWRNKKGAYPVEDISKILPSLRDEADKAKYVDWLFVFGTAIGRQKHEADPGNRIEHGEAVHRVEILSVDSATRITAKVWVPPLGAKGWVFKTAAAKTQVTAVANTGTWDDVNKFYTWVLTLASTTGLAPGDAELIEPLVTVADVWPPLLSTKTQLKLKSPLCDRIPIDRGTGEVLSVGGEQWKVVSQGIESTVTKVKYHEDEQCYWITVSPGGAYTAGRPIKLLEPISTEIFNVALLQKGWCAPLLRDGSVRELVVYKENISPIDFLRDASLDWHDSTGANRKIKIDNTDNRPALPTLGSADLLGTTPNVKREPGKDVGSEINASGLGGGSIFTMDGVTFGLEVCLDHAEHRLWQHYNGPNKRAGDPRVQVQLIPSWGMSIGGGDRGKEVSALPNGLVFNVDGSRMESVARLWDSTYWCDTHHDKTGGSGTKCDRNASFLSGGVVWLKCPHPTHKSSGFALPGCATHGTTPCNVPLRQLGSPIAASSTDEVPSSDNATLFLKKGNVQVFPAKALPPPDVVK